MKAVPPILDWVLRNGIGPALGVGLASAAIVAAAVLSQPAQYRAEIRILSAGNLSADEAEALATKPKVAASAVSLPALSGYNLAARDFFRGADVEQLLEAGLLRLSVRDTNAGRAASRVLAWAQALCAAASSGIAAADGGCYDPNPALPAWMDNDLWWKLLTAALLGSILGYGGWFGRARWSKKGESKHA